ncbi:hypothetical protein [Nannocystis bainbridge]|uniref:SMI1/KNR4 family protein n=1 Tax=Nannocystis bainbridge TaxID=2995303 RepID=A0ABT5E6T5_9BACT|nr:hypothetical protein [Nannocystis bainbridge]MDC0721115.1 hypothetical protein [Nannocystis bainbridge]
MKAFPSLVEQLSDWVMNGRCTVSDLEFYEQYNQEYRPSHWMRNPAADEEFFTFVQDGAGGQYALHLVGELDGDHAPVVKLGRDGEVAVLGRDLIDFAWLIACGVEPIGVGDNGELRDPFEASAPMQAWVRTLDPGRSFGTAQETLQAAAAAYPALVQHIRTLAGT